MLEYWPQAKIREHNEIVNQYTYNPMISLEKALECIENWDSFFHFDIVKAYIIVKNEGGDTRTLPLKRKWTVDEEKEVIAGEPDQGV